MIEETRRHSSRGLPRLRFRRLLERLFGKRLLFGQRFVGRAKIGRDAIFALARDCDRRLRASGAGAWALHALLTGGRALGVVCHDLAVFRLLEEFDQLSECRIVLFGRRRFGRLRGHGGTRRYRCLRRRRCRRGCGCRGRGVGFVIEGVAADAFESVDEAVTGRFALGQRACRQRTRRRLGMRARLRRLNAGDHVIGHAVVEFGQIASRRGVERHLAAQRLVEPPEPIRRRHVARSAGRRWRYAGTVDRRFRCRFRRRGRCLHGRAPGGGVNVNCDGIVSLRPWCIVDIGTLACHFGARTLDWIGGWQVIGLFRRRGCSEQAFERGFAAGRSGNPSLSRRWRHHGRCRLFGGRTGDFHCRQAVFVLLGLLADQIAEPLEGA